MEWKSYLFFVLLSIGFVIAMAVIKLKNNKIIKVKADLLEIENELQKNKKKMNKVKTEFVTEQKHYMNILNSINAGVWEYDFFKECLYLSGRCDQIFDLQIDEKTSEVEYIGEKIIDDDYLNTLKNTYKLISEPNCDFKYSFRIINKNKEIKYIECLGSNKFDKTEQPYYLGGSFIDITKEGNNIMKSEEYAFFDILTGLYNKYYIEQYVDNYLSENLGKSSALIYFDIDDFKYINDIFGHSFGDEIIVQIANRISDFSRKYIVSRFGGDEFCIFIKDIEKVKDGLSSFIKSISEMMDINYDDNNISYKVSISMGISLAPEHGNTFNELLKGADIALNEAKRNGKNRFVYFNSSMIEKLNDRMNLEKELKLAINTEEGLTLYLQPQYSIKTGNLEGFEALIRWISETRGFVSPVDFIPIAEETRLIIPLGKWVLIESCRIIEKLYKIGYSNITISVNLSPVQLMDDALIPLVKDILDKFYINPSSLVLEITESILMENFDINVKKLLELKAMGVNIALDDFGTGYSSLTYLKLLPISTLKIDKSFIDNISNELIDRRIAEEIINLAHILGLTTVAEGVESIDQLEHLKEINCDVIQGYLGGRPTPQNEIFDILDKKLLEK